MVATGNPDPPSAAQPVKPGLFSDTPRANPIGFAEVMHFNAPRFTLGLFRPLLFGPVRPLSRAPKNPEWKADKPSSAASTGSAEWSFRNPFGMTGGDPKHTRAERIRS